MDGYRCIVCAETQTAGFAGFLCPACGGNLDITYDYAAAAKGARTRFMVAPTDLFHYQSLLPTKELGEPFPLRVGATPLYEVPRLGATIGLRHLYLKDDTLNPSASIKDRASAIGVRRALDVGATVISAASTGNAGSSLACIAAAVGMRAVVFVPESAPIAKLTQMMSFGATVLAVRGNYDDAFDLSLAACDEFGWFNRSTGYNAFTREGKKTCSYEIWQALAGRVPDRVVVATGDGNLLSGIWKGWRDLQAIGLIDRLPKIDCAQSVASDAICRTVHKLRAQGNVTINWSSVVVEEVQARTIADSIAVDRPRDGLAAVQAIINSGGEAIAVPDTEILSAITEMARATGVFAEPAAATPYAALKHMVSEGRIGADERVVCVVSGSGLKDIANAQAVAGKPCVIEPSLDAVRSALGRDV